MRTASWTARSVLLFGAMALAGCSSGGSGGTGGSGGKGTGGSGTGGSHTGGAGGSGTGGSATGGVGGGSGGAGGAATGGSGGRAGAGGAGGVAGAAGSCAAGGAGGRPVATPHNNCATIPGPAVPGANGGNSGSAGAAGHGGAGGAGGFSIMSPDFPFCGTIPAANTCDGHDFGTGTNPALMWSGAPAGTMSYAIVFKDISLLGDTVADTPETDINVQHGYHWVMWDIPANVTSLPSGASTGLHSTTIPGAMQWSQRNNYGFFPPCPNPFPAGDARYTCSLTLDSYSFTIYAFNFAHLTPPTPMLNANGEPTGNYAATVARYLDTLLALGVAEYRGTSSAWASTFSPPAGIEYPCVADDRIDGGTNQKDGGVTIDGSALMCLE
jgi:phosphatidylethanolamine-binding protein (PEBP) family uncharacterized protein